MNTVYVYTAVLTAVTRGRQVIEINSTTFENITWISVLYYFLHTICLSI